MPRRADGDLPRRDERLLHGWNVQSCVWLLRPGVSWERRGMRWRRLLQRDVHELVLDGTELWLMRARVRIVAERVLPELLFEYAGNAFLRLRRVLQGLRS